MLDLSNPYDPVDITGCRDDRCCCNGRIISSAMLRAGMDIRQSLAAAFTEKLALGDPRHFHDTDGEVPTVPEQQRHDVSGLQLEILVDLKGKTALGSGELCTCCRRQCSITL